MFLTWLIKCFSPALKQRWLLDIKLEFTTTEHSGLLLYNGRYDGKHDFIAVLVIKGQVQLRFSIFSQTIAVTSNINGGVADGKWHKVEVSFLNRVWKFLLFLILKLHGFTQFCIDSPLQHKDARNSLLRGHLGKPLWCLYLRKFD